MVVRVVMDRQDWQAALARWLSGVQPGRAWEDVLSGLESPHDFYAARAKDGQAKRLGQYFTPDPLCDLMLTWALRRAEDRLLEPGCGTGRFLLRAADLLRERYGASPDQVLSALHGVELDPAAAALCAWQMMRDAPSRAPKVYAGDFLGPLPTEFSGFDAIVGNPPYVRQELLAGQKQTWLPSLKASYAGYLSEFPEQEALFSRTLDLYLLFLLKATHLLKPGGRLAFVMSASWLETARALPILRFLDHGYHLHALLDSGVESWFPSAAINPVVLLAERKPAPNPEPLRLIRLGAPLAELLAEKSPETLLHELLRQSGPPGATVRLVTQAAFCNPKTAAGSAFSLRVTEDLARLRAREGFWRPLSTFGTLRYPLKTGINGFFYLTRETATAFGIEPEFLRPVLKSAREVRTLDIGASALETLLFCCPLSPEELRAAGKTGALAYIAWGEAQQAPARQKRARPVPWPQVASVRGRAHWYQVRPMQPADLLCSRFFDRRFFFAQVEGPVLEDQTFYGLLLNPGADRALLAALLNSTVSYLWLELGGRTSLGGGVLQYSRGQMADHLLPDPALYGAGERAEILSAYAELRRRALLPAGAEAGQADRRALDRLILAPMGMDPETVSRAWCEQVEMRLSRAQSHRKKNKKGN